MSIELKREQITVIPIHPGSVKTSANPGGSMSSESASAQILKVISDLQLNKSGKFVNYKGSELSW